MADTKISADPSKTDLVSQDIFPLLNSESSDANSKTTLGNIKTFTDTDVVKTINSITPTINAINLNHSDLQNIIGTYGQYNHPTNAQMTVLGNTSGVNSGDLNPAVSVMAIAPTSSLPVVDGVAYLMIPSTLNNMILSRAQGVVITAGETGSTTIQIHNLTDTADMLSGLISIDSGETTGIEGTINVLAKEVSTNDVLRIDIKTISTIAPKGLIVVLEFEKI